MVDQPVRIGDYEPKNFGHRYRGSAPLSFRRLGGSAAETLGWWQVGICFVIAVYYAAVIAWAARYTLFSMDKAWGSDPEGFLFGSYLQAGDPGVGLDFVTGVTVPLVLVWVAVLVIMALGVQKGIGATSVVFIPVLLVAFAALVVVALTLEGASAGLEVHHRAAEAAATTAESPANCAGLHPRRRTAPGRRIRASRSLRGFPPLLLRLQLPVWSPIPEYVTGRAMVLWRSDPVIVSRAQSGWPIRCVRTRSAIDCCASTNRK